MNPLTRAELRAILTARGIMAPALNKTGAFKMSATLDVGERKRAGVVQRHGYDYSAGAYARENGRDERLYTLHPTLKSARATWAALANGEALPNTPEQIAAYLDLIDELNPILKEVAA